MRFLKGVIAAFLLLAAVQVEARPRGITAINYAPGQTVLNVGQSSYNFGDDIPFSNFMKTWGLSTTMNGTGNPPQAVDPSADTWDSSGYPTSASLSKAYSAPIYFIPLPIQAGSIVWTLRWSGQFGVSVGGFKITHPITLLTNPNACTIVQNNINGFTVRGTNCIITFTWVTPEVSPTIQFLTGTEFNGSLHDLILARSSDVAGILAGNQTNPDFVATLKQLHPKALRFLNWNGTNNNPQSIQTNYSEIIPASYMSYQMDQYTNWSTNAVTGTNNYALTSGSAVAYTEGLTIQAKFTNAGTSGTQTLCLNNINSCVSPPPIYSSNGDANVTRQMVLAPASYFVAGRIITLRYDALIGGWISNCTGNGCDPGFGGGAPISVMVDLANSVGADLWYNVPCMAADNLVSGVVTEILARLTGNLIIEDANELWNTGYTCTFWNMARGHALGSGSSANADRFTYQGLRTRQISNLVAAAAGAHTNWKLVVAGQFGDYSSYQTYALNGANLNPTSNSALCLWLGGTFSGSCSGAPNYSSAPNRPADITNLAAYAPYYAGAQMGQSDQNYLSFSGQLSLVKTVNGATKGNPTTLQTSAVHGYSTGDRVCTGTPPLSDVYGGSGTAFTGGWTTMNKQCFNVTVTDSTHFTVPFDSSGFANYSSNGGSSQRFGNQMTALLAAADSWAAGNFSAGISALDADVRAGMNYGLSPLAAVNNDLFPISTFAGAGDTATPGYFDDWNALAASYSGTRPNGSSGMQTAMYENGFSGVPPSGAVFTATIDGAGHLIVSAVASGRIGGAPLQYIYGPGVPDYSIWISSGSGGVGTYNLVNAGALTISTPTTFTSGPCAPLGISGSYCGSDGKIANLLGYIGLTATGSFTAPSTNSYKMSSTFQSTVKYQLDQYMGKSNATLPGWLLITGGGTWSLMQGDIYSTPYTSFNAIGAYHFP